MPTLNQLPIGLQAQITALFTPGNFCFLTSKGGRTPTFYFAQGGLAQLSTALRSGRLRTMHRSGPLIDITTSRKRHFFFQHLEDREAVKRLMRLTANTVHRTNGDCRRVMDMVGQVHGTIPRNWHYHYEYTVPAGQPDRVTRTHPSGGRVHLNPRPTNVQVTRLITRLLADNCRIEVDRQARGLPGPWRQRTPMIGAGAYLASL